MLKRISGLFFSICSFVQNVSLSLLLFKNFRIFFCNHLTVGIYYLHKQKVKFPHPVGIVIGKGVIIGKRCTIYQNVTIGTKDTKNYNASKYPVIEDDVTIFANSVVFGGITIGKGAVIGTGSVVFKDVPEYSVVVGNPGKIIKFDE